MRRKGFGSNASASDAVRRPAPEAVRRLRRAFPEVWAWYALLAAARGRDSAAPARADEAPLAACTPGSRRRGISLN